MIIRHRLVPGAAALALLAAALPAHAQIDPVASVAGMQTPGATLMVCPFGDGATLQSAGTFVRVALIDVNGLPIAGYGSNAFEIDGDPPANIADGFQPPGIQFDIMAAGFTNLGNGQYTYDGAVIAGGNAVAARVKVAGVLISGWPQPLRINSPDINGDTNVDLTDVSMFVSLFLAGYDWRIDFNGDGVVNLSDVGLMAAHIGHGLPPGFTIDPID